MISDELRAYFKNMFKDVDSNIVLDDDQINAIINDNPAILILAGAGTGKTTTMVAKVKYLVDIKHVDPSKILVISYTRKAVEELRDIINDKFDINSEVTTFHSLAYKYVKQLFMNRKCAVVDYNFREEVFYDYINKMFKEKRVSELLEYFNSERLGNPYFSQGYFFIKNYKNYDSYDDFFQAYKEFKIEEARNVGFTSLINEWVEKKFKSDKGIITIRGELVKSVGEAVIANFLYKHGIDYSYEKIYEDIVEDRKIYKPDFTLDLAGQPVYLEYFGMNDSSYNKIKNMKIDFHSKNNNKFIYIDRNSIENIEKVLDYKLKELGFLYRDRSDEEVYENIINQNKLSQIFKLKNLFFEVASQIRENVNRNSYDSIIENYLNSLNDEERLIARKQYQLFNEFYVYYNNKLYNPDVYNFDFADLIYYVNKYIADKRYLTDMVSYEYIIVDEYQDISDGEYYLAKNTSIRCNAKVFVVGDDWQSIYAFRGSNIGYITNFERYFNNPTIVSIRNTYRNSQELIDITGEFIKKNPYQINKNLVSYKHLKNPIHFISFDGSVSSNEYLVLEDLIKEIHRIVPDHSILILGRNNSMINNCFKLNDDFIQDIDNKIKIESIDDLELEGMTIHKSKGLTYDEVIIIGMNKSFPNTNHHGFWLKKLFEHISFDEGIEFPEERRLFYVALTRTKNNVFILYNTNSRYRSRFVDELNNICKEMSN